MRYKEIVGEPDEHAWYEPTKNKKLKTYFDSVAWDEVTANLERTPLYARQLEKQTRPPKVQAAPSAELFTFALDSDWKEKLDPRTLEKMRSIIADYEEAKRRCAAYRHIKPSGNYRKDVQRILFSQDREDEISEDELYQTFEWYEAYQIRRSLAALRESYWQFTPSEDREQLLYTILGSHLPPTKEILCDFRSGGYRLLGDILMDLDEQNQDTAMRKYKGILKEDTAQMKSMMLGAIESQDYRQTLIRNCKNIICPTIRHYSGEILEQIDGDDAVKCAEALGKRGFILEVLPASALDLVIDRTTPEKKGRGESLAERVGRILGLHHVS